MTEWYCSINRNGPSTFTITISITNNNCNMALVTSIDCYLQAIGFRCTGNSVLINIIELVSECKGLLKCNCYNNGCDNCNKFLTINETCYSQCHFNLSTQLSNEIQVLENCCFINISDNLKSSTVSPITYSMDNNGKLLSLKNYWHYRFLLTELSCEYL